MRIGILGSTGSIGCNALKVVKNLRNYNFPVDVIFLTTNSNIELFYHQVIEFKPKYVFISDKQEAKNFIEKYKIPDTEIYTEYHDLINIVKEKNYDTLINSLVGFFGLEPTIEAIKAKKRIALANKETLVVAGKLIFSLLKKYGSELYPIDSEHSAILQCMTGENIKNISKVILTASGGPFKDRNIKDMESVTLEEALNHPNWKMGRKITIDSATLMNKGFEVIEARWLFDFNPEIIEVLIHPQSVIHSMLEFSDGSIKAQLGVPDMKIPIQYALTFPERVGSDFPRLEFNKYDNLTFEQPDLSKFECLTLAYKAMELDGTYPVVLNAANEVAVDLFLKEKIKFSDIPKIIRKALDNHKSINNFELEDIIEIDKITRIGILEKQY